jgi:hypothetical protein
VKQYAHDALVNVAVFTQAQRMVDWVTNRCEEKLHEMWRKESRQQEQMSMAFQLVLHWNDVFLGNEEAPG